MNFATGETVTITVKNPIWPMRKAYASYLDIPEFNTYTGQVITSHKAIKPGQIGITAHDPYNPGFNMRVIDIDRIVGSSEAPATAKQDYDIQTWTIAGSKGNEYLVSKEHGQFSCTCPGYAFRGACKHIDEAKNRAVT